MGSCRTSNVVTCGTSSGRTGCPHRSASIGHGKVGGRRIWTFCTRTSELPSSSMGSPRIRPNRGGWTCAGTASSRVLGSSRCAIAGPTSPRGLARSPARSPWCFGSVVGRVPSVPAEPLARRDSRDHGHFSTISSKSVRDHGPVSAVRAVGGVAGVAGAGAAVAGAGAAGAGAGAAGARAGVAGARAGARAGAAGARAGAASWTSQSAPSGGTVSTADAGRPCQGWSTAWTCPMLPTPLPP